MNTARASIVWIDTSGARVDVDYPSAPAHAFAKVEVSADFRSSGEPISGLVMIDTALTHSALDTAALHAIGAQQAGISQMNAHGGVREARTFKVMFRFPISPTFVIPTTVAENTTPVGPEGVIGLIGMDVLRHCRLVLDGISGSCTLSIPTPG